MTNGFEYLRRAPVRLVLQSLGQIKKAGSMYEGVVSARLEKPEGSLVENITLVLAPKPAGQMKWPALKADEATRLVTRTLQSGELLVAVLHGEKTSAAGELAAIPWQSEALPEVQVKYCLVHAPNGQLLLVDSSPLDLNAAWLSQANR